jgi:3-phosphoshikimate 1-carboxyvinyltransferase
MPDKEKDPAPPGGSGARGAAEPSALTPARARRSPPLKGSPRIPGDKSISHRAFILGALTVGETEILAPLEGEDVLATAEVLRHLGATISRGQSETGPTYKVSGFGVQGFAEPAQALDHGNSGTGVRLMMGAVATTPITATFIGDASLSRRPMERVIAPLTRFGAHFTARDGGRLPITLKGADDPLPITYRLPVPSAQVKSAILFAGLAAPGETTVIEPAATRDHTERMLRHFGASVRESETREGRTITVTGQVELKPARIAVPCDPSSAAFPVVAALIVPDSEISLTGILVNPTRAGLYATLIEMGADIDIRNMRESGGEPVADLIVRSSTLKGIDVPESRAPSMIDEYPILAVAAAFAEGRTVMRGLSELKVKESDRLSAIAIGLNACGAKVTVEGDTLIVDGNAGGPAGGASIETQMDHRIAMSFLVMGLATREPIAIDDASMIATSFPTFIDSMRALGAIIETP